MKCQASLAGLFVALLWVMPARADTAVIIRTTSLPALQALCQLPATCTFLRPLDGALGQVILVTTPLPLQTLLGLLNNVAGFVDAEVDQVLSMVGTENLVPSPSSPTLMSDRTLLPLPVQRALGSADFDE
jgi:hypothetical protein